MGQGKINVGVVGGSGYTGGELLRLLVSHPGVELQAITSRAYAGDLVGERFPNLRGWIGIRFSEPDLERLAKCDLVFFATPNGIAMEMAGELLAAGVRVIDLAADYRLKDAATWEQWYGVPHASPELLEMAVYGLPELNRESIRQARLVANPGCYPTAVTLGFLPLIRAGCVEMESLLADAKSGVSGAGRKVETGFLYSEVADSFRAYGVSGHRHYPEICQTLSQVAVGQQVQLVFVPHLVPMIRGIHATLYARLCQVDTDVQTLFETSYRNEPFVDVLPFGSHPDTRSVRGSNMCRIALHRPGNREQLVVLSVIDNLVKGASGQAVQNMNIMFDLEETTGLYGAPLLP